MPVPVYIFIEKLYFVQKLQLRKYFLWKKAERNCNLFLLKEKVIIYNMKFWGFLVNEQTSWLKLKLKFFYVVFFCSQLYIHVPMKLCTISILVNSFVVILKDLTLALMHEYTCISTCTFKLC